MRLRNTFLLALVFILLGAYVYFFELQKGAKEKTERLLNFREEEVAGIILNYPQQEIRLRKEVLGRWKITHPLESAADESTVSAILAALNTGEVKRTFKGKASEADLKNYGLDRPEVKVLITLRNGVALPPIFVGAKTPVGNSAYIRRGAEPGVLLTDASIRSNLEKKLNDFRNKKIMEFNENEAIQLVLRGTRGDFTMNKKGEIWFIDGPKSYRADQAEIKRTLSIIRNISVQDFIEEAPAGLKRYGLDRPRLKVAVFMGEEAGHREILFGNKREGKEEVYLVSDPKGAVYTVQENLLPQLEKDLTVLRDKEILSVPRDQVAKLQITTPKETLVLAKGEKDEWRVEAPKKGVAKQPVVSDYLTLLSRLRAKGFADDEAKDLKKYGLDPPAVKISAAAKDGKIVETLLVGNKTGIEYYAAREGNPTVYTIDEFSYNELNKQLTDFLEQEKKEGPAPGKTKN